MMAIRKYQKAHLCKHISHTGNVLVFVRDSCPVRAYKFNNKIDYVDKATCRECDRFELLDSIDRLNGEESEGGEG